MAPINLLGQNFPVDAATGIIYFAEEVPVKDAPQTDLFTRAQTWLVGSEKNTLTIPENEPARVLTGVINTQLIVKSEQQERIFNLSYTLILEMEDDWYWYRISDFWLEEVLPDTTYSKTRQAPKIPLEACISANYPGSIQNTPLGKELAEAAYQKITSSLASLKAAMLG